jgi:hypothetical protein
MKRNVSIWRLGGLFTRRTFLTTFASFVPTIAMAAASRWPAPKLSFISSNDKGELHLSTIGTKAKPGTTIVEWYQSWGDGTVDYGFGNPPSTLKHVYTATKSYTAELVLKDSKGAMGRFSLTSFITVNPPTPLPTDPPAPGAGCTVTVAADYTAMQNAITAAADGDTVCVSAGTALFTTTLTIPGTKGIWLKGAGAGSTIIRRSGSSFPSNQFRLIDLFVASGNSLAKLSGFTLDQDHPGRTFSIDSFTTNMRVVGHGVDRFRIFNNTITGLSIGGITFVATDNLASEFQNGAELSGLVDHNTLQCDPLNDGSCHSISIVGSPAWFGDMASSIAGGWGAPYARAWTNGLGIGSNKSIYVEDNTFDNNGLDQDGLTDAFGAAQVVIRYNTSNGSQYGNHGFDSAAYRAPRWMEIYRNEMTLGSDNVACGVFRGGGVIFFDNLCDHPTTTKDIAFQLYRARGALTPGIDIFDADHGPCNGGAHTDNVDGNLGTGTNVVDPFPGTGTGGNPGWPCLDQIGWMFDEDGGTSGFVGFPAYVWNNDNGAGGKVAVTNYELDYGNLQNYMVPNRDYFEGKATAQTSPTSPFDGTTGVGYGTLANRPTTCTGPDANGAGGVAYWATDQGDWNVSGNGDGSGVLYKCTSTNTWELYYEPYTYPHPLQSQ